MCWPKARKIFGVQITNAVSATGAAVSISATPRRLGHHDRRHDRPGGRQVTWSVTGDTNVDEGGTARVHDRLAGLLANGEDATVELTLGDLETDGADYAAFAVAVQSVVASRPT